MLLILGTDGHPKPLRQSSRLRVSFQFLGAHALKKIVQRDTLSSINPFTSRIDLCIGLHGRDDGGSCYINLTGSLDDALQSCPDVSLTLWE